MPINPAVRAVSSVWMKYCQRADIRIVHGNGVTHDSLTINPAMQAVSSVWIKYCQRADIRIVHGYGATQGNNTVE